jgi:hypothetical protein
MYGPWVRIPARSQIKTPNSSKNTVWRLFFKELCIVYIVICGKTSKLYGTISAPKKANLAPFGTTGFFENRGTVVATGTRLLIFQEMIQDDATSFIS